MAVTSPEKSGGKGSVSFPQAREAKMEPPTINLFFYLLLTLPLSTRFVIMTTTRTRCSQTMRQKESKVDGSGPWVAM